MRLPYRKRPGRGFVLLCLLLGLCAAFFAWGWRTPDLDRVLQMQLEMRLGERDRLDKDERQLLQETMWDYPALANNMLDDARYGLVSAHIDGVVDLGYAYAVRQDGDTPGLLAVESPTGQKLKLELRTAEAKLSGTANGNKGPLVWALPEGPYPQLIEVRLLEEDEKNKKRRKARPLRIRWRRAETAAP